MQEDHTVDAAWERIIGDEGNNIYGDDERILWELTHFGAICENSLFSQIPEIQAFAKEHVIMGAIVFQKIGDENYREW